MGHGLPKMDMPKIIKFNWCEIISANTANARAECIQRHRYVVRQYSHDWTIAPSQTLNNFKNHQIMIKIKYLNNF